MTPLLEEAFIVDADSHWSETRDLFTARAPEKYRDRVPHVVEVDGVESWVMGEKVLGRFSACGVIDHEGRKSSSYEALRVWKIEQVHEGAYDPKVRLKIMDKFGIDAQVIFPSGIGLGGQFLATDDIELSQITFEIYNDQQAEIQAESGDRLLPLPLMPAYSVEASIAEAKRVARLGARGVNMTSDPHDLGGPDLANREWDLFWQTCVDLHLPVHFHIGASVTNMTFYGSYPWPSHDNDTKLAIGGTLLFIGNARVVVNLILSGVFDRHPDLKVVSVESGCGWIPFILETMDYEMSENAPDSLKKLKKKPSEYFRSNMYATFWFENNWGRLVDLIETVGEDNILFETDYPHPTCLYPDPLKAMEEKMSKLEPTTAKKILGETARKLYRI